MTRELHPAEPYTPADQRVYDQLRHEMETTSHGGLFSIRDMSDDPLGLFHLEQAHFEPKSFDPDRFQELKEGILWPGIITRESYEQLVDGIETVLDSSIVQDHVSPESGGSLLWATNHISYADIAVLMAARTEVNVRARHQAPNTTHVAIASRLISLFALSGLARDGSVGYVVDDGLLELGGYLQTVPSSASGSRLRSITGADVNTPVRTAYHRLLNRGTEFLVAPSGTQDKVDEAGDHLVMDTVSRGTVGMLTEPNQEPGAERLMAIPLFVDCNPFAGGGWAGAVDATHQTLEPRVLHDTAEVTAMMEEIAREGTIYKRPGTLPIIYKRPSVVSRLGEIGAGDTVYKD